MLLLLLLVLLAPSFSREDKLSCTPVHAAVFKQQCSRQTRALKSLNTYVQPMGTFAWVGGSLSY